MGVKHAQIHSTVDVSNFLHGWVASIIWGEGDLDSTWLVNDIILAAVLVTESVSSNDDWRGPSWNASWDVRDDNWLSEDSSIEDVSDGSVWTSPHLLQIELLDSCLVWGDGGALDGDLVLLGSLSSIDSDLIIGLISAGDRQVVVLSLDINVWVDVLHE